MIDAPWKILEGDSLTVLESLPSNHFHAVVTSPPYWALRDYGVTGQLGLEGVPYCWGWVTDKPCGECFVCRMVAVFSEVRRVLRDDGTCWLNIGDSWNAYNGGAGPGSKLSQTDARPQLKSGFGLRAKSLKPKDMVGIPWALAFALRADGWYLRSEVIWAKRSPMPESVRDRPTKAHEQIFLLSKSDRYFYDQQASAEPAVTAGQSVKMADGWDTGPGGHGAFHRDGREAGKANNTVQAESRNMRSVWTLSTEAFSEAHFATYPTELVRRCLLASTSSAGCCAECGKPLARITERERVRTRPGTNCKTSVDRQSGEQIELNGKPWAAAEVGNRDPGRHVTKTTTTGWASGCKCETDLPPVPCRVLDPFSGAGTTAMVARRMHCHAVGIELNPTYAAMARRRIEADAPLFNCTGAA